MRQKGFAPVTILLILLTVGIIGSVAYLKVRPKIVSTETSIPQFLTQSPSPMPSAQPTTESNQPTPTSSIKSPTVTPTPTSTPRPTPTPTPKKNACAVNVINGRSGGGSDNPLLVTLVYSFTGYNGAYMTGARWDFDGDGNWDTDLKQSNGTIEHTYSSSGSYYPRLQLQASDGSTTDVCTKEVTVSAIDVSISGQVYNDLNCNHLFDVGESGIANVSVTVMNANGNVFKTVDVDSSGNYSFTKNIKPSESLTLLVANNSDHSGIYSPLATTLSASRRTAIVNIPQVSPDRYDYCN